MTRGDGSDYTLSPSRMKTLLTGCSEQFAHEYVWGTRRSRALVVTMNGTAIHHAAEVGEKAPQPFYTLPKDEAMENYLTAYREKWVELLEDLDPEIELKSSGRTSAKWPQGDTVERCMERETEGDKGFLWRYDELRRDAHASGWVSMGSEVVLTGVAEAETMRGYADLLLNDGGEPVVVDIKTGSTVLGLTEVQLLSYCWMLQQANIPAYRAEFWWLYGAGFDTQRIVYEFTPAQIATVPMRMAAFAARRDSGIYYPEPSRLCPSCSVQKDCSYWSGEATAATGDKGGRAKTGEGSAQTPIPDPFVGVA